METETKPHPERRKHELVTQILEVFVGRQSRKVAFGVWGFIAANAFLANGKILADVWWKCFLTCALLIGFGTIVDSIIEKMGDQLATRAVEKIKVTEVTSVESTVVPVPPQ